MRSIMITAALTAIGLAAPAAARTPETVVEHVSYRDLDITSAKGHAKLQSRVKAAVVRACRTATADAYQVDAMSKCVAATWTTAEAEIARHRSVSLAALGG